MNSLCLDSSKMRLKRDVPRVLVTSGSRRESPVRLLLRPRSIVGIIRFEPPLSSLSFSLTTTCERWRPPPPRYSIHLLFNDLPTYVHLAHVCTRTRARAHSRLSALVISATFYRRQLLESSTHPRRDRQGNFRGFPRG